MKLAGLVVLYNPSKQIIENLNNYLQFVNKLYVIDNSEKPFFNKQLFKLAYKVLLRNRYDRQ